MPDPETRRLSVRERAAHDAFKQFQDAALRALDAPIRHLSHWSIVALALAAFSVLLVIVGGALAFSDKVPAGVVIAVGGAVSSAVSTLLFTQLRDARLAYEASQLQIIREFRIASDRFFGSSSEPKTILYYGTQPPYQVGQFIKVGNDWKEESIRKDQDFKFDFEFAKRAGNRIFLNDHKRGIQVELDLDGKDIFYSHIADPAKRFYIYKIIAIS